MTLWNQCQKAASMLDDIRPGWYKEIDTHILRMSDCYHCILGQIGYDTLPAPDMSDKVDKLGLPRHAMGFGSLDLTYPLKKYWITLINQRLNKKEK